MIAGGLRLAENGHSRAKFQLSHKGVWRTMRLFVAAMGKSRKLQIVWTDTFADTIIAFANKVG
jgi:hypothetical protein